MHIYFDRNNRFRDCLLQDNDRNTQSLTFEHEQDLRQISHNFMSPIVSQLFTAYQNATATYHSNRDKFQAEIDTASKSLFTLLLSKNPHSEARKLYIDSANAWIKIEQSYNAIALRPSTGVIQCLQHGIEFLNSHPTTLVNKGKTTVSSNSKPLPHKSPKTTKAKKDRNEP